MRFLLFLLSVWKDQTSHKMLTSLSGGGTSDKLDHVAAFCQGAAGQGSITYHIIQQIILTYAFFTRLHLKTGKLQFALLKY
jgi:hypothetical protein